MPRVSIVIPAYNAENTVTETLESVADQTFKDYETVVVDDGSTDHTSEIVSRFGSEVILLSKQNGGPASARNLGIKKSSGFYIAFLDADDIWKPNKLEIQMEYMSQHDDVGFSYTQAECFSLDKHNKKIGRRDFICDLEGYVFKDLFWSNFIINSSVMAKKSALAKVGLLDESKALIGAEDYDLWLRLSRKYKLGCIKDKLLYYRLGENSLVGESYEKAFPTHVYIYRKFYREFHDTKTLYGLSENEALFDLYVRYAFKDFVSENYTRSLNKTIRSVRYNATKALLAFLGFSLRVKNRSFWERIMPKFSLWSSICAAEW